MGNASRGLLRGPGLSTWDLSLNKDTVMPFYGEVPFAWFTKHLGTYGYQSSAACFLCAS